jgi:hypothetical protein
MPTRAVQSGKEIACDSSSRCPTHSASRQTCHFRTHCNRPPRSRFFCIDLTASPIRDSLPAVCTLISSVPSTAQFAVPQRNLRKHHSRLRGYCDRGLQLRPLNRLAIAFTFSSPSWIILEILVHGSHFQISVALSLWVPLVAQYGTVLKASETHHMANDG